MTVMRSTVRKRDGVFELRCESCLTYAALDDDNWIARHGFRRCRACWLEYHRLKEAGRSQVEAVRELKLANGRIAYRLNREERLAYNRRWKAANRERVAEYNRKYRERAA